VLPSVNNDFAASCGGNHLTNVARIAVPVVEKFAIWKAC